MLKFRYDCDAPGCSAYVTLAPELFDGYEGGSEHGTYGYVTVLDGVLPIPDGWDAAGGRHLCPAHSRVPA
jgi:hypothetical protein